RDPMNFILERRPQGSGAVPAQHKPVPGRRRFGEGRRECVALFLQQLAEFDRAGPFVVTEVPRFAPVARLAAVRLTFGGIAKSPAVDLRAVLRFGESAL